jgi:hypothetical protein
LSLFANPTLLKLIDKPTTQQQILEEEFELVVPFFRLEFLFILLGDLVPYCFVGIIAPWNWIV